MTSRAVKWNGIVLLFGVVGCSGSDGNGGSHEPPDAGDSAPVLTRTIVDMAPWDGVDGSTAGGFLFDSSEPEAPFIVFGAMMEGKVFPNIEYRTVLDAPVFAPCDAVITRAAAQEGDYELFLQTSEGSPYLVSIDHVRNPTVSEGDTVRAGDQLGIAGPWSDTRGRVELQVNDDVAQQYRCPLALVGAGSLAAWRTGHADLMSDWESLKGDPSAFDEASMVEPACLVSSIDYDQIP